ncbi:MAG: hypothetical protein EXR79_10840 [Myxococcales bacterium]|nr:hypothetical protein [Myxococcales bacterium]
MATPPFEPATPTTGSTTGPGAPSAAAIAVTAPADPERRDARDERMGLHAWAVARLLVPRVSPIDVGVLAGATTPATALATARRPWEGRTRLGAIWNEAGRGPAVKRSTAVLELDLLADDFSGNTGIDDVTHPLAPALQSRVRRGWLEAVTSVGLFGAGRTLSTWGLGLIAHDGEDDAMQFGARRSGTIVDRVQYAIAPAMIAAPSDAANALPLFVALALDRVVRDDSADLDDDDRARNALLAVLYRSRSFEAGLYGVLREHRDDRGLGLDARILDGYVRARVGAGGGELELAAEAVGIVGTTTWLRSAAHTDALDVEQWGALVRADWSRPLLDEKRGLRVRLEAGAASGDDRPFDGALRPFRMSADHRPTLLLFPDAVRAQTLQSIRTVTDPRYSGQPPVGLEHLDSRGAVTNALYVTPAVRVQPWPYLAVLVAATWARAAVPVVDPFRSSLVGGAPVAWRGAADATGLGFELDAAIEGRAPLPLQVWAIFRLDGGYLQPGTAFDAADGSAATPVTGWLGQCRLERRF